MSKTSLVIICLLIGSVAYAQVPDSKRQQKWRTTIEGLEKTEFVQKYSKAKERIESQITEFHRNKATHNAADVEEVHKGYEATVANFDKLLDDLKSNFMSKENRQMMAKFPDKYTKMYNAELEDIVRVYNNNCLVKMEALNPESGAFGLMDVGLIIQLGNELIKMIREQQNKIEKMSATYFEDNFVHKLRLKKWDAY